MRLIDRILARFKRKPSYLDNFTEEMAQDLCDVMNKYFCKIRPGMTIKLARPKTLGDLEFEPDEDWNPEEIYIHE